MEKVFSEFELKKIGLKFNSLSTYTSVDCIGSAEEALDSKVIVKKCRGVVIKTIVKGTGTGKLKIKAHVPTAIYKQAYGMKIANLVAGVDAYGSNSRHEGFAIVEQILDEDGNEKYKAYPNCIVTSGIARSIENGAEEVTELDLEIDIMPDENGNGMYEAIASGITETLANAWMTEFTPSLVVNVTSFAITSTLTNVSSTNDDATISRGGTYSTELVATTGYVLPETVTITMAGTAVVAGTGYIYNDTTGALVVPNVTGVLVITAVGTPEA